jgi:hypothetical protein
VAADYNDGNWHDWRGGECPVHPKSEVKAQELNGPWWQAIAEQNDWPSFRGRFRVVTPYIEAEPDQQESHIAAHAAWFAREWPHISTYSGRFFDMQAAWLAAMAQKGGE